MIILITQENYQQLVELDTASGDYRFLERSVEDSQPKIQGMFANLGGHNLFFYRNNGVLFLRVDGTVVNLNNKVAISLDSSDEQHRRLVIVENGKQVVSLQYDRPLTDPPLSLDPTPFVSEEDFDFGLYLYNVVNDLGRRSRVFPDS